MAETGDDNQKNDDRGQRLEAGTEHWYTFIAKLLSHGQIKLGQASRIVRDVEKKEEKGGTKP